jgi:sulfite reductase alpha subunit-like flavoprotein
MADVVSIIIKGGIVMIPLLACSLIALALTIERLIFWTGLKSKDVLQQILALVEDGDFETAVNLASTSGQPIARVLAAGIAHRNPAPAKAMEAAAQAEIPVLKSRLGILDTIVTLAPLLVASTYGDGEPPDDAASFWEAVVYGNSLDLTGVRFSVLALGNTTYDHFCKCGRELDAALERHGAARLYPRVDCGVDYDAPAKRWMEGVIAILRREQNFSAMA